jgi:hypothetical protein
VQIAQTETELLKIDLRGRIDKISGGLCLSLADWFGELDRFSCGKGLGFGGGRSGRWFGGGGGDDVRNLRDRVVSDGDLLR